MKKLTRRAARFHGMTVGLDVHQAFIECVILDEQGDEEWGGRVPSTRAGLAVLWGRIGERRAQYVLEACSCFLWVWDELAARVGREQVHAAQPHRVRPIAASMEKNDANDAWWLAYLCFEGRLPEAYVAEGEVRELRIATRELRRVVEERADLMRRLRSHLVQSGQRVEAKNLHARKSRQAVRERIAETTGMRRVAVERLLARIEGLDGEVTWWREEVSRQCAGLPVVQTMVREIDGLGPVTAGVLYGELGDPRRYARAKSYARATGLPPGNRETGGRSSRMGMSRAGSASSRWALTRAVIAAHRCRQGGGAQLRQWVKRRGERGQKKRVVIVAAARKLAECVWRLFALGECFDMARAFPGKARA